MVAIDEKAQHIHALVADFRQEKFTPLMKKPLVSSGTIHATGSTALWNTQQPEPTRMLVNDREIQIYYPKQSAEEIYPIAGKLGSLASSPLPRLEALKQFFTFRQIPVDDPTPDADPANELMLELHPIDDALRQHVMQVRVLLDGSTGLVKIAETTDPDGERTSLTFSHVKLNPPQQAELTLDIPAGTTVSHPMEGLGGDSNADPSGAPH